MKREFQVKNGKIINLKYEEGNFDCYLSQLTSLEGCPKEIEGQFVCSENLLLIDISDLPLNCQEMMIDNCPKITKFPNQIKNTLIFYWPTGWVRRRIKKTTFL